MNSYVVYILQCNDGTLYTGSTNNIIKRLDVHNSGKGARYTRCRLPCTLLFYTKTMSRSEACKLEYKIKQLERNKKIKYLKELNEKI